MAVHAPKHAFTVEEYHRMAEAGIFTEDDRVELVEGEVLEMAAIGRRHAGIVNRLTRIFSRGLGDRAVITVQNPVELGDRSEPEPDLSIARPRSDFYGESHPTPAEIFLLVEVTDTSHQYDQHKIAVSAHHGVPETWQVNVEENSVTVFREPSAEGYRAVTRVSPGESLSPKPFPDLVITVSDIIGA
jgi:Uma2 family endonuclease